VEVDGYVRRCIVAVLSGYPVDIWGNLRVWKHSFVPGSIGSSIRSKYAFLYDNWDCGSTVRRIRDTLEKVRRITNMAFVILLMAAGIVTAVVN
jgi:hypothetical protein